MSSPNVPAYSPAFGTILVRNGTPELVRQAVSAHALLDKKEVPKQFPIAIAKTRDGSVVVRFPEGAPPYDIVNLIAWLHAPPNVKGVSHAMGWITSPSTGVRYSLMSDPTNAWEDTLVGASSDGRAVRVYLPEAAMCEISQRIMAVPEPDPESEIADTRLIMTVAMDVAPGFGNPDFTITHETDTEWGP